MVSDRRRPLWFKGVSAEDWVTRFTIGEDYHWDSILLPYDAQATLAHARGLASAGVLSEDELVAAQNCLDRLLALCNDGELAVGPDDEDSHTVIESFLSEEVGEVGRKIHTGRSRNDQVLAALRLFLRDQLRDVGRMSSRLASVLCDLAERYDDALMPGYTHLQPAMPTTAGLWAAGYAELLADDVGVLREAYGHVNVSPLGSAAGYGVPHLAIPRDMVADDLGFDSVQRNVTSVQLSRGKIELHAGHALVQVGATLNRLASDLVLFNTREFGFVTLPESLCTGSSIMPQKRNPDVLELIRAKYHRLVAETTVLLTLPTNMPSGYHRDLQLTKEAVMRLAVTAAEIVHAAVEVALRIEFDRQRMRQACGPELFATTRAMRLVMQGVPFRDAYRQAAGIDTATVEESPLESYSVEGYPGRVALTEIRERLAAEAVWIG